MVEANDFNAIRISLASPEQIRGWSYGEVTKPETINYRTLKPERDGLFCERIFGPTKDFECYCGKYKRMRYKGVVCDKCGVEVTRSKVRRERMGHIELASPVAHIWFSKGTPSRLGLLLDLSPRSLERVLYFAQFIVTSVDGENRRRVIQQMRDEASCEMTRRDKQAAERIEEVMSRLGGELEELEAGDLIDSEMIERQRLPRQEIAHIHQELAQAREEVMNSLAARIEEVEEIHPMMLLSEGRYQELRDNYLDVFEAGIGAEAILNILKRLDLAELRESLSRGSRSTSGQKRKKAIKRLRVVEAFRRSGAKPEWMIVTVLPVLPPDLRPMVQLDGGRFATSDLNDLYRRVINRNNRLRRLIDLGAPEIIIRNEKRMLQEAVDSLIDNGRRGKPVTSGGNHKLKSLSDMLRGKQGRFRQNLLGKRVDYSGRSVIVVGPELKLHQCGLPKRMALELFKPFVIRRLVEQGYAHTIKSAKRLVDRAKPEVWDILEEVIKERPILLNRAPTLHRLGIQAFEPVLIDGSAIQIHPLVCTAFNADFDGDQMAIHIPLSKAAIREAREVMLSTNNMLLPSSGEPVIAPTLDIVLGCYYLTSIHPWAKGGIFGSFDEARLAHELGGLELGAEIEVRDKGGQRIKTSAGRIIFNEVIPEEFGFLNKAMDKQALKAVIAECYKLLGKEKTATLADDIKQLGFHYATKSGTTISMNDIEAPQSKVKLLEEAEGMIAEIERQYQRGLITDDERYNSAINTWTEATYKLSDAISESLPRYGGIYMMATSGAKGNIAQITQMAGMRGLMTDPSGRIIDFPIRSSFREGLSVLEYFISTHGARKGLADTALRTSNSGYLTRRLIDVSQDVIVLEDDCGTTSGIWLGESQREGILTPLSERIIGRRAASRIVHPQSGEPILERGEEIDEEKASEIVSCGISEVYVRSPLTCQSSRGVCRRCYGRSLATGRAVDIGEAVGIIAAQSIGEPGTQLTLRTFHTGGVVGQDITSGLPRVEELFEARAPKGHAIISEIDGTVGITQTDGTYRIRVTSTELYRDEYPLPQGCVRLVGSNEWVEIGTSLARVPTPATEEEEIASLSPAIVARVAGRAQFEGEQLFVSYEEREEREYAVPTASRILVEDCAHVMAGEQLTDGPVNPQDILRIMGKEAVQRYLVDEIQKVYHSQGVNINDKHIEVIVRQMLRKVKVDSPGDTDVLPGELVDRFHYEEINAKVLAEGGEPATAQTVLLGITKASLNTDSFLAAASFQETTRVLTEAAVCGKTDRLLGLKENVIIGKLIPARCASSREEALKEKLGLETALAEGIPI